MANVRIVKVGIRVPCHAVYCRRPANYAIETNGVSAPQARIFLCADCVQHILESMDEELIKFALPKWLKSENIINALKKSPKVREAFNEVMGEEIKKRVENELKKYYEAMEEEVNKRVEKELKKIANAKEKNQTDEKQAEEKEKISKTENKADEKTPKKSSSKAGAKK